MPPVLGSRLTRVEQKTTSAFVSIEYVRGIRDRLRLQGILPEFRQYERWRGRFTQKILPYYREYTEQVSTPVMSISPQLSIFLLATCETLKPKRIADLGSGFSSVVLRMYERDGGTNATVWSADDSASWLFKTRRFLMEHSLPSDNLLEWEQLKEESHRFDLVLHDLGGADLRRDSLPDVLALTSRSGYLILDDANQRKYNLFVREILKQTRFRWYSLRSFTIDQFRRYSMLVIPQNIRE